jgi:hypothetical protein
MMFGLSRLLQLAGSVGWRLNGKDRRRLDSRPGFVRRRRALEIQELEGRIVPTLFGQQLFPADNPWNQNIGNAPVAANSAAVIANIGASVHIHPDWGADNPADGASPLYGIPFNVVHGNSTAKVNVVIDNYPGESDIQAVPIPQNAVIEGDYENGPNPNGAGYNAGQRGDSHLIVWDEDNNIAYELFGVSRPSDPTLFPNTSGVELAHTDGQWHAAQETVWNMKTDTFRTLGETSADAAGLSILAGLVRPDEGLTVSQGGQGAINHAIRFTLPSSAVNPQYIYPASHQVDETQASNKLPLGARLRLQNTPAVNAIINAMPPESQIIARAMQQYGLILADIGSAMFVTGASATTDTVDSPNTNLTWDLNDIFASNGLKALTAGDFDVLNLTPVVTGLSASSGAPGSTITITGQNFSGAAGQLSVFFGSTPASSVTVLSDTQISAVVPNGSGTVNVTVQSGVNETDTISSNPNANVNAPIFGYGTSATSSADLFTFSSSTYSLTAGALTPPSAVEGQPFSNNTIFHFTDSNPAAMVSSYTAQVTLGNGSTVTLTSTASANGQIVAHSGGGYDVQLSYTYGEELSGRTFSVSVSAVNGEATSATTASFTVADAALTASAATFNATVNSAVSGVTVATFTDADPAGNASDYSASVNWGDGDTSSSVSVVADSHVAGQFDVVASKSHPYTAAGSFPVTVSINDAGGATAAVQSTANVSNTTVTITVTGTTIAPTEGNAFSGTVATFTDVDQTDPVSAYTAKITWGDGSTSLGTVQTTSTQGKFTVSGAHTYAEAGSATITIAITDTDGSSAQATSTANVKDAALTGSAVNFSVGRNNAYTGQVAIFNDGNPSAPLSDFTASINWADGTTSTGTVSARTGGGFQVQGSHTYKKNGSYPFVVTITDQDGSSLTVTGTATVTGSRGIGVGGGNAILGGGVSPSVATGTNATASSNQPSGSALVNHALAGGSSSTATAVNTPSAAAAVTPTSANGVFPPTDDGPILANDELTGWLSVGKPAR